MLFQINNFLYIFFSKSDKLFKNINKDVTRFKNINKIISKIIKKICFRKIIKKIINQVKYIIVVSIKISSN